ncbi:tetratricopeptide repeat protein [uncultured Tateyamaria sp.]|uniref:tetratricopeptide repeat protein n=1 Tax=uncultured Tateyamaria sp. TaxID=455651 RepID=UPI002612402B|nr:tetratricopeptide repeat protein [uncultured Tateyamaria sp.]
MKPAFIALALTLALVGPTSAQTTPVPLTTLQSAAQSGAPDAQLALALRYLNGDGVLQNHATAAQWLTAAAQAGNAEAQNRLGQLYFEGLGVAQNTATARDLLTRAAQSGTPQYLFDLGIVLEASGDATAAAERYEQAAASGHPDAATSLGVMYHNGTGRPQDLNRARALYEQATAQNHPRALNNLGLLYVRGEGVDQDYARAADYFQRAAELGLRTAMTNLGVLYENALGVPLNEELAQDLYRLGGSGGTGGTLASFVYDPRLRAPEETADAIRNMTELADAGDPIAMFQTAWLLATNPERDFQMLRAAAHLFAITAEQGHGPSMANLSLMYFRGQGQPQDYVLGQMWLLLAQRAGVDTAALTAEFGRQPSIKQITQAQTLAQEHISR